MSRHRNVRSMKYDDDDFDDDYDDYSRSMEDNYCISPSTAAQFTYNRDRDVDFSVYMDSKPVIDEEEEEDLEDDKADPLQNSANMTRLISDEDKARLNSCLDQVHSVLGDTVPESEMKSVILDKNFNIEASINQLLMAQDAPKPQRAPRQRRNRSQASQNTTQTNCPPSDASAPPVPSATSTTLPAQVLDNTSSLQSSHIPTPKSVNVTPAKSTSEATRGFDVPKETPPCSPQVNRKPDLKLKIQNQTPSKSQGHNTSKLKTEEDTVPGVDKTLRNAVEFMGLDGDKETIQASVDAIKSTQSTPKGKSKGSKIDVLAEYAKRFGDKELLNLVVIGHVDAGKSTLMGHLLYQLGSVNKKLMHKYEQDSRKLGKSSFAYAWVLDETDEERARGVTMDVAQTRFSTDKKLVTLLDAPGHKDFIPNMITGASQADVGILVINATRGEFETGFELGGQTREHALLARSLGVGQIIVAVNKMDTVEWSKERYDFISKKIGQFLSRQAGFKDADVSFVPVSGLSGENLTSPAKEPQLKEWFTPGHTLIEMIDKLKPPQRPIDKPFRLNVSDVFKGIGTGFNVAGRVGSGYIQPGDKVFVLPAGMPAVIKAVFIDEIQSSVAFAGDHVNLTLSGIDMANVNIGSAICDPSEPSKVATRIRAKLVLFNMEVPITKGFPVVFHYQSINEPAVIKRLISQLNRSSGEVIKKKPRCLGKNSSAVVEIEFERSMCLELFSDYKDLGRFMLRNGGHTIAAGVVEEIVQAKTQPNGAT